jgi:hypothetical protein
MHAEEFPLQVRKEDIHSLHRDWQGREEENILQELPRKEVTCEPRSF